MRKMESAKLRQNTNTVVNQTVTPATFLRVTVIVL